MRVNPGFIQRKRMIVSLLKGHNLYNYIELEVLFGKPSRRVDCVGPEMLQEVVMSATAYPFSGDIKQRKFILACFFVIALPGYLHFHKDNFFKDNLSSFEEKIVLCI